MILLTSCMFLQNCLHCGRKQPWEHVRTHHFSPVIFNVLIVFVFQVTDGFTLCWLSARSGRKRQQDVTANLSKTETVCGDTDWTVFRRDDMISPSSTCLPSSFCYPANCLIIKCFICLHTNTQERDLAFSKRLKKRETRDKTLLSKYKDFSEIIVAPGSPTFLRHYITAS